MSPVIPAKRPVPAVTRPTPAKVPRAVSNTETPLISAESDRARTSIANQPIMLYREEILALRIGENGRRRCEDQETKREYSRFHTSHFYLFLLFCEFRFAGMSLR